jgi:hypothetical protein
MDKGSKGKRVGANKRSRTKRGRRQMGEGSPEERVGENKLPGEEGSEEGKLGRESQRK